MNRIITILTVLCITLSLSAQDVISLDGEWQFRYAVDKESADRLMSDFEKHGFQKTKMDFIQVPSNWAVLGYEEPIYRGFKNNMASEGFYLKSFTVPDEMLSKRLLLHFDGVWSSAEVWLNGKQIGYHQGGYTPFALDITEKLQTQNDLMVRVRQVDRGYEFDVYDDWTLGGIYRSVAIESMPRRRSIEKISYTVDFDSYYRDATLNVKAMIHDMQKNTLPGNYPSPGAPYALLVNLKDAEGDVVSTQEVSVPAHVSTDREVCFTMNITSPLHWTAETPSLYRLEVALKESDEITHIRSCNVGFREISTEGGVFRINGRAVKLRGVNRHDEYPTVGRATQREHWLKDITMMKEANINYIRCAHYTPAKGFVELCDSLGMYLGNEVSLGGAGMLMYDPSMIDGVLQRTYETIERDINNPSIVYWSIGNEDPLTSQHMASVKLAKAIDPSRPVLLPWRAEEWLPEEIDILAPHYWQVHEYDSLASVSTRPIITTEYTHAFGHDGFGSLKARWDALTSHPSGAGAAVWMWADQGIQTPVKKDPKKMGISKDEYLRISEAGWDGVVDSYRNFTRDYHELKAVYAYVYPMEECMSYTMNDMFVDINIYNGYDFRDLNTVNISWKLFSGREMIAEGKSDPVNAPAHTTGLLRVPVSSLDMCQNNRNYLLLTFISQDGYEIATRSIELISDSQTSEVTTVQSGLTITEDDKFYKLTSGLNVFTFDKTKGILVSVDKNGTRVMSELRPCLWHKIDRGDRSVIGKNNIKVCPNLDKYTYDLVSWETVSDNNSVIVKAKVNHVIDSGNVIEAIYTYTVTGSGQLEVNYKISPELIIPNIPVVGMKFKLSDKSKGNVEWFGKGPYTSHPNRRAAGNLGCWEAKAADASTTSWIFAYKEIYCGADLTISGNGYFEYDGKQEYISIYSDVLGRPEKGRKALDVPQLKTDEDVFVGGFLLDIQ